jgi:HlyD family secretion protein
MRILRFLIPVLIVGAGAAGAVTLFKTRPIAEPLATQEKVWSVDVTEVQRTTEQPELTLYARVESPRSARLSSAVTADVVGVHVREGSIVEKGTLLVKLDDRESVLTLRQRQAERAEIEAQIEVEKQRNKNDEDALQRELRVLQLARRAVQRASDLATKNVGSRSQLDTAQQEAEQRSMSVDARRTALDGYLSRMAQLNARHARAKALEDRAQLDVTRTRVFAPFSGPVYSVGVSPGDRVQPGTALLAMYDVEALEMRVQIPTGHLPRIQTAISAGEKVIASAVLDQRPITATLARMSAQVARGSGGVDGLFKVDSGGLWLQIGRTVEIKVRMPAETNAIALPTRALYGNGHVYRVEDGRMQRITVSRIGEFDNAGARQVLVRSTQLGPGDQIVTTQLPNAADGLKVKVQG